MGQANPTSLTTYRFKPAALAHELNYFGHVIQGDVEFVRNFANGTGFAGLRDTQKHQDAQAKIGKTSQLHEFLTSGGGAGNRTID